MSGADHNLLVAALALQLEFVGRDALAATLATWSADRTRPLDELLVSSGLLGRDRCDLLLRLVSEQLLTRPDDARRLLAALPAIQTLRESLARCKDPEVSALLSTIGAPATVPPESAGVPCESEVAASRRFRVVRL